MVDISAGELDVGQRKESGSSTIKKPKPCISELSIAALVAAAMAMSTALWFAVLAVL